MKGGRNWLGLDIGGANLKAAHESGPSRSQPFELWKRPDQLSQAIRALIHDLPAWDGLAITMTAELCDCYETKSEGVSHVLDALPTQDVSVWGVDGRFYTPAEARSAPHRVAASNWMALATVVARLETIETPALLIDIGSTTTDLTSLDQGRVVARGRTDTERLVTQELLYAGVRRTPLCALATELPFRGQNTGLAAELFATTLDIYLTIGEVPEAQSDLATADGRPATIGRARDRLARMVGADRDGFTSDDAWVLSQTIDQMLVARIEAAARRSCLPTIGHPHMVVVAGSGEFLARRVASRLVDETKIVSLSQLWGSAASDAACAHAVVRLAKELG